MFVDKGAIFAETISIIWKHVNAKEKYVVAATIFNLTMWVKTIRTNVQSLMIDFIKIYFES
jgi:hypothetical protein